MAFPNYGYDIIQLQDWPEFLKHLKELAMRFLKDPELQYVVVENVSVDDIEYINYLRSCCELPQMRVLYNEEKRLMIVKLMLGRLPHQVAILLFNDLFREMVPLSTGILGVGSARFGEANNRHKEPNRSFVQRNICLPDPDWPSVVVEVGLSENLTKLHEDAQYWLINSNGRVFVVIIISIGLSTREVIWERWEHVPSIGPATRRETTIIHPTLMQTVILPPGGPVIGAPFSIPSNKIWDIVPNHIGAEIVFTAQHLETYSRSLLQFIP